MDSSCFLFSKEVSDKLEVYYGLIKSWQNKYNLIGSSTLKNTWERHFIDSAQLFSLLPEEKKKSFVYDIGSGAGFPGMVLAIMGRKDIILCESNAKKCNFLEEVKKKTGANVIIDNIRAEALPLNSAVAVTARAVSSLSTLLKISLPLLSKNGVCIFPKGINWKKELLFAQKRFHIDYKLVKSITSEKSSIIVINEARKKNA
ncbi:MAG: 16S rRNA (guanine(527)-N(7))-methyltransferase RsmG [Pelagibacterales bacterium]|nr:16S rRNA (guanine(527)-N(7))-methyltransferase RsmG [Pelagibacterales bacterium]PPR16631.1 MAG: Ribosomal RNA small subunit methyltransferase G [Alphaproteobacteria bacterium MarineAlpha9_Bin3]|tara:strand:+ start:37635 stop:38240 length:606 start_codon:yes stop_codon:yes gene_type:complete